jgi:thiol:disulfide interchange protein DsbC
MKPIHIAALLALSLYGATTTFLLIRQDPALVSAAASGVLPQQANAAAAPAVQTLDKKPPFDKARSVLAEPVPGLEEGGPDAFELFPSQGMAFVRRGSDVMLISSEARFVLTGNFEIQDAWTRETLRTPEDLARVANTIDAALLPLDKMSTVTVGKGDASIIVFVDPNCGYCSQIMDWVEHNAADDYAVTYVLLPLLGKRSIDLVKRMHCAIVDGKPELAKAALVQRAYDALPEHGNCDMSALELNLFTAKTLGLQGVPFVINPHNRFNRGMPQDIAAFLQEK